MFESLTLAEINCQHAELLPARTVLSLFSTQGGGAGGREGGNGQGGIGVDLLNINALGTQAHPQDTGGNSGGTAGGGIVNYG